MRISWKLLNILLFKEIYITCSFFREKFSKKDILTKYVSILICWCRSSHPGMFLGKGVLKICSKFTGEHPCRKVISITLLCNFIEITLRHGCSPVNLLHIFTNLFVRTPLGGCFCWWKVTHDVQGILVETCGSADAPALQRNEPMKSISDSIRKLLLRAIDHLFHLNIQQGRKQRITLEIVSNWIKSYTNRQISIEYV